MGLLAPWFLAGLAALAIPFYVHLLRRHKSTPRPFSSLMFFEPRTQSSIKHRRLRYLLLMAMRLALLALLVMAFANPFVRREAAVGGDQGLLLVVVDNSFSMRAGGRLERARGDALRVLAGRPPERQAQVMALGSRLDVLTQPLRDQQQLEAALRSIRPSDTRSGYGEMARALRLLAQSSRLPLDVHFFTDAQKSGLPAAFSDLRLPGGAAFTVHAAARGAEPNWAVEKVSAPASVGDPKKARVEATIAGYNTPAAARAVSLRVNGKTVATRTVEVPAGGRAAVEFNGLEAPYGFSRCEVSIDGADILKEDDALLFAVERGDPRRVLFLHEARDSRSPVYFRAALAASAEASFAIEAVTPDRAADLDPARYAFTVLSDTAWLPENFEKELSRAVRGGSSVLLAAGPSMARRRELPVIGLKVGEPRYFSRAGERFQSVGSVDAEHPSIRRAARWEGVKFYQAVEVEPGDARVAARLSGNTPLLVDKKIGEGRALLLASALDNLSNDFPLHPAFVPFVEQTARYLAGIEERAPMLAVDSFIELRTAREQTMAVELILPGGERPLSLRESTQASNYRAVQAGFYEVKSAAGRREVVAVNADRRESDLTPVPDETMALWKNTGNGPVRAAGAADAGSRPWSLWWYFMLGALALFFFESLYAGRFLSVRQEA